MDEVASRPVMPVGTSSARSSPALKRFGVAGLMVLVERVVLSWRALGAVEVEVEQGRKVERMWWRLCRVDERGEF